MTMVVDLGLERYFYGEDHTPHERALERIVSSGAAKLVRDLVGCSGRATLRVAKVYEVRRWRGKIRSRYLEDEDAAAIIDDVAKTWEKYDSYASFSWQETEELGLYMCSELAFRIDDKEVREVAVLEEQKARIMDLRDSLRLNYQGLRHPQAKIAAALHRLASKHHMIIHTA